MSSPSESLIDLAYKGDVGGLRSLLSQHKDIDINYGDARYGQTALSWAAEFGHKEVVDLLLENKADVGIQDKMNHTAFFWASQNGQKAIVLRLLELTGPVGESGDVGGLSTADVTTIFLSAATAGWQEVISHFLGLPTFDVNLTDRNGNTALMYASHWGHLDVVEQLMKREADIFLANSDGDTALVFAIRGGHKSVFDTLSGGDKQLGASDHRLLVAASEKGDVDIILKLLNTGAVPWKADEDGFLPLHRAANKDRIDAVRLLIKHMGDDWIPTLLSKENKETKMLSALAIAVGVVDDQDPWGDDEERKRNYCNAGDDTNSCALHYAAAYGWYEAAKRLLGWGVEVDVLDDDGTSALYFAADFGQKEIVSWLLKDYPDEVNFDRRVHVYTPLLIAVEQGFTDVVELLCNSGKANINATLSDGTNSTPLMLSARRGDLESAQHILNRNPNLEIGSGSGQTALTIAITCKSLEIVKMLVKAKADIKTMDRESKSPIAHAVEAGIDYLKPILVGPEDRPRADAVEIALRYSCRKDYAEITSFILTWKDCLHSKDETGRSILSLAAQQGNRIEVEKLCDKELDPAQKDRSGRTPISWAAVGRDEETIKILLAHPKADRLADEPDNKKRTPLAWAAEGGHVSAVKYLLDFNASDGPRRDQGLKYEEPGMSAKSGVGIVSEKPPSGATMPGRRDQSTHKIKKGAKKITIDSRDNDDFTPLCHAAVNGHKEVVDLLLDYGANPRAQILRDTDVIEMVEKKLTDLRPSSPKDSTSPGETAPQTGNQGDDPKVQDKGGKLALLEEIKKKLGSFESLDTRVEGSASVDKEFSATVVDILEGQGYAAPKHEMRSVDEVLEKGLGPPENDVAVKWIHLPANNMKWVENLMSKLFGTAGGREARFILQNIRWLNKQHKSSEKNPPHHARFMHPSCDSFDLAKLDSAHDGDKDAGPTRGFVVFMPYLHWETVGEYKVLEKAGGKTDKESNPTENPDPIATAATTAARTDQVTETAPNGTEKLYKTYLNIDRPLHIRRTLDQFHYRDVIDTSRRDNDQTCHRYCEKHLKITDVNDRVTVMVDQLWLWVIPGWKGSRPLVITAFPQRANRIKSSSSRKMTALIFRILQHCGDLRVRTSYDLAEIIVGECSRIFFDDRSRLEAKLQFFDIYSRSIAVIADKETSRFDQFKKNVQGYGERLGEVETEASAEDNAKDRASLIELIDIKADIADLREIKDIKEELSMMSSLFHFQMDVADTLYPLLVEESDYIYHSQRGTDTTPSELSKRSAQDDAAYRKHHSPMLSAIKKGLDQLAQLERAADSAIVNIQQLLDLKNKQANLREVKSSRELDQKLYDLSQQTRRQARTIMVFTVFTIVFLPPSFMSSFLALDISQFPWKDGKLSLSYVLKSLLSVSFGIIVPTLLFAFYGDVKEKLRKLKRGNTEKPDPGSGGENSTSGRLTTTGSRVVENGGKYTPKGPPGGDEEQGYGGSGQQVPPAGTNPPTAEHTRPAPVPDNTGKA